MLAVRSGPCGAPRAAREVAVRLPVDAALDASPSRLPSDALRLLRVDLRLTSPIQADDKRFRYQAESVPLQGDCETTLEPRVPS